MFSRSAAVRRFRDGAPEVVGAWRQAPIREVFSISCCRGGLYAELRSARLGNPIPPGRLGRPLFVVRAGRAGDSLLPPPGRLEVPGGSGILSSCPTHDAARLHAAYKPLSPRRRVRDDALHGQG